LEDRPIVPAVLALLAHPFVVSLQPAAKRFPPMAPLPVALIFPAAHQSPLAPHVLLPMMSPWEYRFQ